MIYSLFYLIFAALLSLGSPALAQEAPETISKISGEVEAGSIENEVRILIVNLDKEKPAKGISAKPRALSKGITKVTLTPKSIETLAPGATGEFTLRFDMSEKLEPGSLHQIVIDVTSQEGLLSANTATVEVAVADVLHEDPVATEIRVEPESVKQYVYVLTEIKVKDVTWSDGAMSSQTEHKPNQPGYLQRTKSPIHTQIEMVRCIDYPNRIVLGESIHFKLDARTRYDTKEYRCNGTPGDRWPPSLSITTSKGLFEANTKGKALHFPSCQELGVKGRKDTRKNEHVIINEGTVFDPVGLTLDESVTLVADFKFTGDATDYDAVFHNDPAFNYSVKYSSDGKMSRETQENKITVEYSNRKLKTPEYLMSNEFWFQFNELSLIYTLQVNGTPKPVNVVPFEMPLEFDKPPLGGARVGGKEDVETSEESQLGEDIVEADGNGIQTGSDAKSRSETTGKTASSQTQQDKKIFGQSVTAEGDPDNPESIDPNHPKIKGLINEWIRKAEPIANASGAGLRFDKWGRVEGRAVGGIITLHGRPDDVAGRTPEKYVWDMRDKLDSVDHCTLGEYVTAKLGDKSLDHCKNRYKPQVSDVAGVTINETAGAIESAIQAGITLPNVIGMTFEKAAGTIKRAGLKVLPPELGNQTSVEGKVGTVEQAVPEHDGQLRPDDGVTLYLYGEEIVSNKVPNVIGQQLAKASAAVKKAGLNLIIELGDETNNPKKEGTIYSQAPVAGSEVGAGANVTLLVYNFIAETYVVPNVLGLQLASARDAVKQAGFNPILELGEETGDPEKDGAIARQAPAPGTEIEAGRDVTLFIYTLAAEAQEVTFPDVAGMSLTDAVAALEAVGLFALPEVGRSALNPEDVGKVEVAFPAKDGEVHAGDQIVLRVYDEAVDSGNVPNVTGMQLAEAADVIKLAGFNPVFELGDETSDPKKDGTVASQAPAPGLEIEAGKDVTLIIYSLAVETRTVPNLKGMGLKAAQEKLKSNDLFITPFLEKAASKKSDEGKVYKQYPEPGLDVMNGIAISVWVYGEHEEENQEINATNRIPYITLPITIANTKFHERYDDKKTTTRMPSDGKIKNPDKKNNNKGKYFIKGHHWVNYYLNRTEYEDGFTKDYDVRVHLSVSWYGLGSDLPSYMLNKCGSDYYTNMSDYKGFGQWCNYPYGGGTILGAHRVMFYSPDKNIQVEGYFDYSKSINKSKYLNEIYKAAKRLYEQIEPFAASCN